MMMHQRTLGDWVASYQNLLLLIGVVAMIAVVLLATAVIGVRALGPSLDLVPDPAGGLFPF